MHMNIKMQEFVQKYFTHFFYRVHLFSFIAIYFIDTRKREDVWKINKVIKQIY